MDQLGAAMGCIKQGGSHPDWVAADYNSRSGEWSVHKDIEFERHLKRLERHVKNGACFEPTWYGYRNAA